MKKKVIGNVIFWPWRQKGKKNGIVISDIQDKRERKWLDIHSFIQIHHPLFFRLYIHFHLVVDGL